MFKKKTIRVEFYNAETGEKIGYDDHKLKRLPEDFDAVTLVEINGIKYEVVQAEPDVRKKIKRAGTLVIQMKPVKEEGSEPFQSGFSNSLHEDSYTPPPKPKKTFVSASKPDIFPAFTGQRGELRILEMGTWEWRAVEFIAAKHELDIKTEFASIRDLKAYHTVEEAGRERYTKQHRRSLIVNPLGEMSTSLEALSETHFAGNQPAEGISFMGSEGHADGGFGLRLSGGMTVYGLEAGEQVKALGLSSWHASNAVGLGQIAAFMVANDLWIVDWEELVCVQGEVAELEAWLVQKTKTKAAEQAKEAEALVVEPVAPLESEAPEAAIETVESATAEGEEAIEEAAETIELAAETEVEALAPAMASPVENAVEDIVGEAVSEGVEVVEEPAEALEAIVEEAAVPSLEVEGEEAENEELTGALEGVETAIPTSEVTEVPITETPAPEPQLEAIPLSEEIVEEVAKEEE